MIGFQVSKPKSVQLIFAYFLIMGLVHLFSLLLMVVFFIQGKGPKLSLFWIIKSVLELGIIGVMSLVAAFQFDKKHKWTRYAFYFLAVVFIINILIGNISYLGARSFPDFISIVQLIAAFWVLYNLNKPPIVNWFQNKN